MIPNVASRTWPKVVSGSAILLNVAYLGWVALPLLSMAQGPSGGPFSLEQEMSQVLLGVAALLLLALLLGAILNFWKGARWGLSFLFLGGVGAFAAAITTLDQTKAQLGWALAAVDLVVLGVVAIQSRDPRDEGSSALE